MDLANVLARRVARRAIPIVLTVACSIPAGPVSTPSSSPPPTATVSVVEASPSPSPSPTTPSEAPGTSPAPTASGQTFTPPPLIPLEVKIIDALGSIGVTAHRAEHPAPESASISASLGDAGQLFVGAHRVGIGGEFFVVDERLVEEVKVQRINRLSRLQPLSHRFDCSGHTYEVWGHVPAGFGEFEALVATHTGFADFEALVAAFIRALDCGS